MEIKEEDYLAHYGILRKSGRYPWGSGANPNQRSKTFMDIVEKHKKDDGMSEAEIAKAYGMTTNELRATKSLAVNQQRQDNIRQADRLAAKGMSNVAIGERMGINESSVRSLRAPGAKDKADVLQNTADMLKRQVEEKGVIDIGTQVERSLPIGDNPAQLVGISKEKLGTAVALLKEQGYKVHTVKVIQQGTGNLTTFRVLAKPDVRWSDIRRDPSLIKPITEHTEDGGRAYTALRRPESVSSKRIQIAYKEDGGANKDGLIELRPGVKDLDMGKANYAQVRIAVDKSHYLKGMAVYNKDLPAGVDIRFNTNKSKKDTDKMGAMKEMEKGKTGKPDLDNPFTSSIKPGGQRGALNIVNEKGDWDGHSVNLASQMLSKQNPKLARTQLELTQDRRRKELDSILALTNPTVKRRLLDAYADETDSASVHLKAAGRPQQSTKVLIPVTSVKAHEIYAPSLRDGTRVALVRYPHGGTFEIPKLTVNNRNPEARKLLNPSKSPDVVGIHHKVAERLSGADFDGDTAIVIPLKGSEIISTPALKGLEGFDPRAQYRVDPKVRKTISKDKKEHEMGFASNLITDMTLKGANSEELARAVRHSMVVIDSEKHNLDYQASKRDHGITQLYKKYQDRSGGGASTLISKASGRKDVLQRKPRPAAQGGPIDKKTGRRVYVETGNEYTNKRGKVVRSTTRTTKLAEATDAHNLVSGQGGTEIERIYADHSNRLKGMANEARRAMVNTKPNPYSKSAKAVYSKEVDSLNSQLDVALRNAPRERQAQAVANAIVSQKYQARPDMDNDDKKKVRRQALNEARVRTGADKTRIQLTQREWDAIQAGAISNHKLEQILRNADLDSVRKLATPKPKLLMSTAKRAQAQALFDRGYTQAEVADALGVALTTLKLSLAEE